uniref:Uncharacterized protein n=1 Tax=Panagrellus redivivus TaxID=6233 RepID=A0A7E4V614_PANRE
MLWYALVLILLIGSIQADEREVLPSAPSNAHEALRLPKRIGTFPDERSTMRKPLPDEFFKRRVNIRKPLPDRFF